MKIPQSAIEPFGIVGIPVMRSIVGQLGDKLRDTFEWFRASFVNDGISSDELCWILCQKAIQFGAHNAECDYEALKNGKGNIQMHAFFINIYMKDGNEYELDFHIKIPSSPNSTVWSFP